MLKVITLLAWDQLARLGGALSACCLPSNKQRFHYHSFREAAHPLNMTPHPLKKKGTKYFIDGISVN